jgi:hypothetical protein
MRKGNGQAAKLSFAGHALMENRCGLLVDVRVTEANGRCEREAAIDMLNEADAAEAATLGADAGYDARSFVEACRDLGFTPHVAQKKYSAVDRRTTRHEAYAASQRVRKSIEQVWGWMKTVAGFARLATEGEREISCCSTLPAPPTACSGWHGCSRSLRHDDRAGKHHLDRMRRTGEPVTGRQEGKQENTNSKQRMCSQTAARGDSSAPPPAGT